MAYSYSLTASELINMSLKMMNITSLPDAAESVDYNYCVSVLNMMLKSWSVEDGIRLWKRKQGAIFPSYNQNSYEVGSVSGADNCSLANDYVATISSAAASVGGNTITLTTVTGMSVSDNIGIELDDKSRQWTTIINIDTGTLVVTLNDVLTDDVTSGNTVITYTNKINRPLEILRATVLDLSSNTEISLMKLTYDDYFDLPIKALNGRPVNFYYDRAINNALPYTGTLYLYLNPDSSKYIIQFSYSDAIQDIAGPSDSLDFPQEWYLTIATNLAVTLSLFGYGKLVEADATRQLAEQLKNKLRSADSDDEYLSFKFDGSKY